MSPVKPRATVWHIVALHAATERCGETTPIEWGWIDKRPAKLKRYPEERGRITYLTIDQIKRLIDGAKQDQNPQVYPFIVIGLETSMRRTEILSIRREHVDLQRRVIYIPQAKARAREQPITAHLASFLEQYLAALPEGTPWLFPSLAAQSGHTVDIRKPFRRAVVAVGLDPDEVVRHTLAPSRHHPPGTGRGGPANGQADFRP